MTEATHSSSSSVSGNRVSLAVGGVGRVGQCWAFAVGMTHSLAVMSYLHIRLVKQGNYQLGEPGHSGPNFPGCGKKRLPA